MEIAIIAACIPPAWFVSRPLVKMTKWFGFR